MSTESLAPPATSHAGPQYRLVEWDLFTSARELADLRQVGPTIGCYALLRLDGRPVGRLLVPPRSQPLSVQELEQLAIEGCGSVLDDILRNRGLERVALFGGEKARPSHESGATTTTAASDIESPADRRTPMTVTAVVCTRDRPEGLRAAVSSLLAQTYANLQVLVVDNAPRTTAAKDVVGEFERTGETRVHYVLEPTPGLSVARNRALREIDCAVVAWLDDDETADPNWAAEIVSGFESHPQAAAVSGFVFPSELDTTAQVYYESYGGHSKGRIFAPLLFDPHSVDCPDPLFPVPPFGVGANMAFRCDVLRSLGGFDEALGAGTLTQGGEDTLIFSRLLLTGHACLYQPTAVTLHSHRRDLAAFRRQMHGYGSGLSAFYAALIVDDWRRTGRLLRLLTRGVTALRGKGEADSAVLGAIPAPFVRAKWRGFFAGPFLYAYARRRNARRRQSAADRIGA